MSINAKTINIASQFRGPKVTVLFKFAFRVFIFVIRYAHFEKIPLICVPSISYCSFGSRNVQSKISSELILNFDILRKIKICSISLKFWEKVTTNNNPDYSSCQHKFWHFFTNLYLFYFGSR